MTTVHGDVDGVGGVTFDAFLASPEDGSAGADDVELELERTIDVQTIDRHLARVGDRSCQQGLPAGGEDEEGEKRNEVSRHPLTIASRGRQSILGAGQPLHGGGAVGVVSL